MTARPNILFFHVDNLGFGELSCYSGGPFRGTWTRADRRVRRRGFRLTNYCAGGAVHADPVGAADRPLRDPFGHPQRPARRARRLGAGGLGADARRPAVGEAGYACAAYGKWHVGEGPGRWPTDKGFDGVVRPAAHLRRGAVADRPVVRPRARPGLADGRDQAGRRGRHRARPADARRAPRLRRRVPAARRGVHPAQRRGDDHRSSSTSTIR